jgi:hypothetical protein
MDKDSLTSKYSKIIKFSSNKFDSLDKIDKFFEKLILPKQTQKVKI